MGASSAMLAVVVREAIGQIAAPDVAERIEREALQRAGHDEFPVDPAVLRDFVEADLFATIVDCLGEDVAESVKADLAPILATAESQRAPPSMPVMPELPPFETPSSSPPESLPDVVPLARAEASGVQATDKSRVLLADGDPDLLQATAESLRAEGYEVVTAADGYAALELCQSMGPAVVVADLHMPAIGGRQLIQTLERTMGRDAPPVIIVSGNVFAPNNIEGAAEVMRKPVDLEDLSTAIELAAWDHAAGI